MNTDPHLERWKQLMGEVLAQHRDCDATVIETVLAHGSDAALPHRLRYYLYGSRENLELIRRLAADRGWQVEDLDGGLRVSTGWIELSFNKIHEVTTTLVLAAAMYKCEFDGWETAVRKKHDGEPETLPS